MKKNIVIIVLLIVIAILSVLLYLNTKNTNVVEENKIAEGNIVDNTLEVNNTVTHEEETNTTKEEVEEVEELDFSEEEIKECLQNYLNICGARNGSPSGLAQYLFKDAEIYYDEMEGTYIKTSVSYNDFREKMLTCMSEKEYTKFINEGYDKPNFKNINGILYVNNTGASGDYWEVDSIKKIDTNTYNGKTFWIFEDVTREEVHFEFTITESNGKCVIDSCSDGEKE